MTCPRLTRAAAGTLTLVAGLGLVGSAAATAAAGSPSVHRLTVTAAWLEAAVEPLMVTYGETATVSGVLVDADGVPVADTPIVAEARAAEGSWTVVAGPVRSDPAGAVALPLAPIASSIVRLRQDAGPDSVVSHPVRVAVRAELTGTVGSRFVGIRRPVTLSGSLAPTPPGATVRLQRRVGNEWRRVGDVAVETDGTWSARVRPGALGFARFRVVSQTSAGVLRATAALPRVDVVRLHRYSVTTRGVVGADLVRLRELLAATYDDPRGWRRSHRRFVEVARGGDFTVVLAQASTVPTFASFCSSRWSCRAGRFVVLNADRWRSGSPYFPGDLLTYRQMVINHETGHWLGRGHARCSGSGRLAPVMAQQSKGLAGCRPNPWPRGWEIKAVS